MKVDYSKDWCMNMAKREEGHEAWPIVGGLHSGSGCTHVHELKEGAALRHGWRGRQADAPRVRDAQDDVQAVPCAARGRAEA